MMSRFGTANSDSGTTSASLPASSPAASGGVQPKAPEELRAHLESSLTERCAVLAATFAEGSPDALTLIDMIAKPAEHVIRRAPIAAQRSLKLARNENSSTSQLAELISGDPTLAQGLLRLANSAEYATSGSHCTSIADAIRRVGARGVESVVLRCMVEGLFCRPGGAYQSMSDLIWAHMVRCAPIGRALGRLFSTNQDDAFLLSMMHDVGKLVVFDRIVSLRTVQRRDAKFPASFVGALLRLVHEPLGGLAALEWGLGEKAAGAIASHHRREVFEFSDLTSQLLFAAERADLARACGGPADIDAWIALGALTTTATLIHNTIETMPAEKVA
ncbi:MAG: HDOD domain-containing protein [Gemmatimonadaceae bacterium]